MGVEFICGCFAEKHFRRQNCLGCRGRQYYRSDARVRLQRLV